MSEFSTSSMSSPSARQVRFESLGPPLEATILRHVRIGVQTDNFNLGQLILILLSRGKWHPHTDEEKRSMYEDMLKANEISYAPIEGSVIERLEQYWQPKLGDIVHSFKELISDVQCKWMHFDPTWRETSKKIVEQLRQFQDNVTGRVIRVVPDERELRHMERKTRRTIAKFFKFKKEDHFALPHYEKNLASKRPDVELLAQYTRHLHFPEMLIKSRDMVKHIDKSWTFWDRKFLLNKSRKIPLENFRNSYHQWNCLNDQRNQILVEKVDKILKSFEHEPGQQPGDNMVKTAICMLRLVSFCWHFHCFQSLNLSI